MVDMGVLKHAHLALVEDRACVVVRQRFKWFVPPLKKILEQTIK